MTNPLHYPSLDRCKKLTELGFPHTAMHFEKGCESFTDTESSYDDDEYVCPSVMEMLDAMPTKLPTGGHRTIVSYEKYSRVFYGRDMRGFAKGTLPNTLADLIIWLVENSHLTFPSNE